MKKCIDGAKLLIENQVKNNEVCIIGVPFSEFQKTYSWTNEFIPGYLDLVSFDNKSNALSVLASGDHIFNLIVKGITNIDTFDTNRLTEYYALGFKRAMILKYDYDDFILITRYIDSEYASIDGISTLILELLPYMEEKHAIYWKEIVDYNYKIQKEFDTNLNLFKIMTLHNNFSDMIIYNNYLIGENEYNLLRERLIKSNISFKCCNAHNLKDEFVGKYDFILLSNILDYFFKIFKFDWGDEQLQEYEKGLMDITKSDGVIFLKYIFRYGFNGKVMKKHSLIENSSITIKELINEEVYGLRNIPNTKKFDGMILKRVK